MTGTGSGRDDLYAYLDADQALHDSRTQVKELEHSAAVETFNAQLDLLRRRLLADPTSFREMFIEEGMQAIAWEFRQEELSKKFTKALWEMLLRDDDASKVLMRFLWTVPLKLKRKFVRAIDAHLSSRYSMFDGLSVDWPAGNAIPPYVREPAARSQDFELVNQGYLGYMRLGYSAREVELFVWLEAMRDKQCEEKPCEIGVHLNPGAAKPEITGGCPVRIHIPQVLELVGTGHFQEAMELIESCNPLPDVTGRVCPQEVQCQGVCIQTKRPIEIGQLEWYLPEREKLVNPGSSAHLLFGRPDPWQVGNKPPVAIVGSGPSGLINAYLLANEGFPVTIFEAFHALGGVLRYGIPEFRLPNELIDDVVGKIKLLGGKFVSNFVVGKTATLQELREAGFWKIFVGTGAGLPRFMNIPGEHYLNVMSANEFLTRVNLMQGLRDDFETPLPETKDKQVLVIGGGNTAMDAARTAHRLGGDVTIVYRRTRAEMPARVEELDHALEEGIKLRVLRSPYEFLGDPKTHFVRSAHLDVMTLGEPDESGRRSPVVTGAARDHQRGPGDHGAGQRLQPDHQGLRARAAHLQVGHPGARPRGLPGDLARRHLHRRRRRPRRVHRDPGGRRRSGRCPRDPRQRRPGARGDPADGDQRPGLHRARRQAVHHPRQGRARRGDHGVHGRRAADRARGAGRPVRPRAAHGRR